MSDLSEIHKTLVSLAGTVGEIKSNVDRNYEHSQSVSEDLKDHQTEMRDAMSNVNEKIDATDTKIAKYENRGLGIVSGLVLAGGSIGAGLTEAVARFKGG